jgi:N-acetylglucosaminyl-diphospho-decaprenol L-rhamnosyltransferase
MDGKNDVQAGVPEDCHAFSEARYGPARPLSQDRETMTPEPTTAENPDITVLVVNYNTVHLLDRMFKALRDAGANLRLQIIVVDNASSDGSVKFLREKFSDVEVIESTRNVGFGRANNLAIPHLRGRYVLLLNTDAFVSTDTLSKSLDFMEQHPKCGVMGVKLVGEDGALQPSCRYFPTPWNVFLARTGLARFFPNVRLVDDMSWNHNSIRECDWVPGCYYLIRREVIDRVGLFDPRYFLYCEEVDHCRAVKNDGWTVFFYPLTQVIHIGGESAKAEGPITASGRQISAIQVESELLYLRKHYGLGGLVQAILLATVSDLFTIAKALLLSRNKERLNIAIKEFELRIATLFKTKLAKQPTR